MYVMPTKLRLSLHFAMTKISRALSATWEISGEVPPTPWTIRPWAPGGVGFDAV